MNKTRIALLVVALLLLSVSITYSLMPDRFIQALPTGVKFMGLCLLVLGIIFEIVCARSDLKNHFSPKIEDSGAAQASREKKPLQSPAPTREDGKPE